MFGGRSRTVAVIILSDVLLCLTVFTDFLEEVYMTLATLLMIADAEATERGSQTRASNSAVLL